MKINDARTLVIVLSSLALATFVRADETAYGQILKERDAVLAKILAVQEARLSNGTADPEMVFTARIALGSFRRDTAATKEEKIRQQELLVQEHERNRVTLKARSDAGIGHPIDELLAADKFLDAKQVLAELRMQK